MTANAPDSRPQRQNSERPRQIGALLVLLGGLALLAQFGLFGGLDDFVFALLFAAGGAWLIRRYRTQGGAWSLPVGFGLLGLAAAAVTPDAIGGMSFLGLLGIGFVALQWDERTRWWPLIPGGVLITLGIVAGADELFPRFDVGPLLFLGLAATFYWLTRLRETPQRWAIYPALGALAIGILSLSFTGGWLFPLLLVGAGLYLLSRGGNLGEIGDTIARESGRLFGRTPEAPAPSPAPSPTPTPSPAPAQPQTAATSDAEPAPEQGATTSAVEADATEATEAADAPDEHGDDEVERHA